MIQEIMNDSCENQQRNGIPENSNNNFSSFKLKWSNLSESRRVFIIFQISLLLIYFLALYAYWGEAGHFRFTPQLLFWLVGTTFWAFKVFGVSTSRGGVLKFLSILSITSYLIADILIFLFITGMIDLSITDRGYRRLFGLAIPLTESPPSIRSIHEIFKKDDVGKRISFFTKGGEIFISFELKYRPLPETINIWEGALNIPPRNFELKDFKTLISATNYNENTMRISDVEFSVRYSYDTRENKLEEIAKANLFLQMEIGVVASAVRSLLALPNVISLTEIPHFEFSSQEGQLTKMSESVAKEVYLLQYTLKKAEESRKVAANLLGQQGTSEFQVHSIAYFSYLNSAKEQIELILNQL